MADWYPFAFVGGLHETFSELDRLTFTGAVLYPARVNDIPAALPRSVLAVERIAGVLPRLELIQISNFLAEFR